jgi:hypothetical protein
MKPLNEFSTGYPTVIGNSQSQEYQGALGPIDAETVQGKDRLNCETPEGLHRINNFISHFFRRTTLNPQNEIAQLRVRLNHLMLDFPFDNTKPVDAVNNFIVTKGGLDTFGVTPTTDLSQGFDRGEDLPKYNLEVRVIKTDGGFKLEGKMTPANKLTESIIEKGQRASRINSLKKVMENMEAARADRLTDPGKDKARETVKDSRRINRTLKSTKR